MKSQGHGAGRLQRERQRLGVHEARAPGGHGRADDVAVQLLEPGAVVGRYPRGRVQGETPCCIAQSAAMHPVLRNKEQ